MKQAQFDLIANLLIDGQHTAIGPAVEEALVMEASASDVLNEGLLKGMGVVGVRFRDGDMFLPEVLMSAQAMKTAMQILEPLFLQGEHTFRGRVIMATVKGDIHDIGKNLVSIMLRGNGYEVIDLGINCTTDDVLRSLEEHLPDVCGLSAMLTTTMISMQQTVKTIREKYPEQKVIVGGAPVSKKFGEEIGAHAYGHDAMHAVEIVDELLGYENT